MSIAAIIMMIIAVVTVWGGLVLSIAHLMKHPDDEAGV